MSEPPRSWRRVVVAVVATTLLAGHFVASALHVGPMNPVSLRLAPVTQSYLLPYFEQTWTLFAPDPISEDRGLLARYRCVDETVTGWVDISTRHVESVQATRFFPPRNSRLVSNGTTLLTTNDPIADRLRDLDLDDRAALPLTDAEVDIRERGIAFLTRYALAEEPDVCDGSPDAVQLRVVQHKFPPFSQRHQWDRTGKVDEHDLPWTPSEEVRS